jgi:hypothetical protein
LRVTDCKALTGQQTLAVFDQEQNFVLETLLNDARAAALLSRYFVILTEINAWASRAILVLRR